MDKKQKGLKAWNPLTSLYLIIVLAIVSVLFDYRITLLIVAAMIILAAVSGVGMAFTKLWLKSIVLVCIICFILQSLFIPGEKTLWSLWIFTVTEEGVSKAIVLCSRILGVGSAILISPLCSIGYRTSWPGQCRAWRPAWRLRPACHNFSFPCRGPPQSLPGRS